MKRFNNILIAILSIAILFPAFAEAKKKKVDIYELSFDENLEFPEIENDRQASRIQDYQYEAAVALKKQNYEVELMRNNEVIVVTLPAGQLFEANDTTLTSLGRTSLKPFLKYLKNPGFYKMLLVMHSDNTGSAQYTKWLTNARINAVFDWVEENESVDWVVPYAMGADDPLVDNNSISNRKQNRRLEIYLIPDEVMLAQSKRGKINIKQSLAK
ncbi:MAG: OmpA family protein [Muribaculaceae bacterium]|nr:OmpA family protein [Muribaculaceae bacterium]